MPQNPGVEEEQQESTPRKQQDPPTKQPKREEPPKEEEPPKKDQDPDQKKESKDDPEKDKPKPPLRQRVFHFVAVHPAGVLLGGIGLVILIIASVFLFAYLNSYESTDDAEVDGHLNQISSRVTGTVVGVYVEDNQWVKAGQLLVDLDPRDFNVAIEQARADLAEAHAQVTAEHPNIPIIQTTNQSNVSTAQTDVAGAQAAVASAQQDYEAKLAAVRQAQANNVKAQKDVQRYQLLVDKEEISEQQFDAVVATAKTEAAGVDAAQASADAARKIVDQRKEQLAGASTRLTQTNENGPRTLAIQRANVAARGAAAEASKARLDQASLNLSYAKIYAAVDGIVTQKSVEVGQRVQAGQQLMEISQLDDIWITANFKETQLKRMRPSQSVDISVDAFDTTYHGYLESLPGATGAVTSLLPPENATGNFVKVVQRLPVRIRLKPGEDPQHNLRPGMSVEPKVWLNTGQ